MRIILGLCAALFLTACADPSSDQIRPGVAAKDITDTIRPPSGRTYNYSVLQDGLPIPAALTLTSRRLSARTYSYDGAMVFQVPGDEKVLKEVAAQTAKVFRSKSLKIRGNRVFVPVTLRTDNRFRSKTSSLLATDDRFTPHDCFATLGTCRYTVSNDGRERQLVTTTTETGGIWRTLTKAAQPSSGDGSRGSMIYSLDENAMVIDLALSSNRNGDRSTILFTRQRYEP